VQLDVPSLAQLTPAKSAAGELGMPAQPVCTATQQMGEILHKRKSARSRKCQECALQTNIPSSVTSPSNAITPTVCKAARPWSLQELATETNCTRHMLNHKMCEPNEQKKRCLLHLPALQQYVSMLGIHVAD
jgi:hypothetical protein